MKIFKKILFLILSVFLATNLHGYEETQKNETTFNFDEESFIENIIEELSIDIQEAVTRENSNLEENNISLPDGFSLPENITRENLLENNNDESEEFSRPRTIREMMQAEERTE